MLLQFAHFLDEEWQRKGRDAVSVTVNAKCALNGRPNQTMVSSNRNLLLIDRNQLASEWIQPLITQMQPRVQPSEKTTDKDS